MKNLRNKIREAEQIVRIVEKWSTCYPRCRWQSYPWNSGIRVVVLVFVVVATVLSDRGTPLLHHRFIYELSSKLEIRHATGTKWKPTIFFFSICIEVCVYMHIEYEKIKRSPFSLMRCTQKWKQALQAWCFHSQLLLLNLRSHVSCNHYNWMMLSLRSPDTELQNAKELRKYYYSLLQSLHKTLPSTTSHNKARTKHKVDFLQWLFW